MAYASLAPAQGAALDVAQATLTLPRYGAWHADLVVDVPADALPLGAAVTLTLGSGAASWKGTVFRGGEVFGSLQLRIVGGAGGLARPLPGQSYRNAVASTVLKDLLSGVGEALDPTADAATLATPLPAWSRLAGPAASQLEALRSALGVTWRMLATGKVWLGPESWPLAPAFDFDLLAVNARENTWLLNAALAYQLLPGMTLGGQHVDVVEHAVAADALRTTVYFA